MESHIGLCLGCWGRPSFLPSPSPPRAATGGGTPRSIVPPPLPRASTMPALLQHGYTALLPPVHHAPLTLLYFFPSNVVTQSSGFTQQRKDMSGNRPRSPFPCVTLPYIASHSLTRSLVHTASRSHMHDESQRNPDHKPVTPGSHPRRLVLPAQMGIQCSQCSLNYCTQRIDGAAGDSLM